jgi:hypothetical protein
MRFDLAVRFIEYIQMTATNNCSFVTNSHTLQSTAACMKSSQSVMSTGNGFQWRRYLKLCVHGFTSLLTVT